ncbi:MAG: SDR family oxidoreductase [Clostridia bacterium]
MDFIKEKVIVVLGASSGIGAEISEFFCKHGAYVQLAARRENRLKEVCQKINLASAKTVAYYTVCDATSYEDVEKLANETLENFGTIDLWVNCTGQNKAIGNTWEIDQKTIWDEIDTNLHSCTNGTHVALKYMVPKNEGSIFNFCGGGTAMPHLYASAYSASKTAIARFTEAVQLELDEANLNVKVFAGNPGLVYNERTHLLTVDENSLKYMPNIKTAFETGKHHPSSNIATYISYILSGKIDGYAGKLAQAPKNIEEVIANNELFINNEKGLLRIVD